MKIYAAVTTWKTDRAYHDNPSAIYICAESRDAALQLIAQDMLNHDSYWRASKRWQEERPMVWLIESSEDTSSPGILTWKHSERRLEVVPPPEPEVGANGKAFYSLAIPALEEAEKFICHTYGVAADAEHGDPTLAIVREALTTGGYK